MSVTARRLTKRQKMSLQFQSWAPPQMPRAQLERIVPHVAADGLACALGLVGGKLTVSLSRVAAAVVRVEGWKPHGYTRAGDFTREKLDRSSRWLWDLAALGEGLSLPGLEAALWGRDGRRPLGRVAATFIARVATPASVGAWIELARGSTVRALQQAVREARQAGSNAPVGDAAARVASTSKKEESTSTPGTSSPVATTDPQTRRVLEPELDEDESYEARFSVPPAVRAAFEEALDLHRAVTGHQASLSSFTEALAAEACAGACPPDTEIVQIEHTDRARAFEERLACDSRMWKILGLPQLVSADLDPSSGLNSQPGPDSQPGPSSKPGPREIDRNRLGNGQPIPFDPTATDSRPEMAAVRELLQRIESRTALEPTGDPKKLVRELRALVALESEIERSLGRLLAEMDRRRDWACLQFRDLGHYAEQRLGISRRTAERRAGLVRALRPLPQVRTAYETGQISQHAAWLLYGIFKRGSSADHSAVDARNDHGANSNPETKDGKQPTVPRSKLARLQALDSRFARPWIARAREATVKRLSDDARWTVLVEHGLLGIQETSRGFPLPPSDADWHASLRRVPGMARERVARLGWQALERTHDNVFLRLRIPQDLAALFLASVEGARRDLEVRAPGNVETIRGLPPSLTAARRFRKKGMPVPTWAALLALLEDYVRVWDDPKGTQKRQWDATYERDGYRCMAPGCTARCGIEDHHIHYRAHQGSDEPWNQLCLCKFHHQQGEHGNFARVRGKAPLDVIWRLGASDLGSWFRNERRIPNPNTG
jgi:hypothetical protein